MGEAPKKAQKRKLELKCRTALPKRKKEKHAIEKKARPAKTTRSARRKKEGDAAGTMKHVQQTRHVQQFQKPISARSPTKRKGKEDFVETVNPKSQ